MRGTSVGYMGVGRLEKEKVPLATAHRCCGRHVRRLQSCPQMTYSEELTYREGPCEERVT